MVKSGEILTFILFLVVGYVIVKMFSRSCEGFGKHCEVLKNKLITNFNDYERNEHNRKWGFDTGRYVLITPWHFMGRDKFDEVHKLINTEGCKFSDLFVLRHPETGSITDLVKDLDPKSLYPMPNIYSYFPTTW